MQSLKNYSGRKVVNEQTTLSSMDYGNYSYQTSLKDYKCFGGNNVNANVTKNTTEYVKGKSRPQKFKKNDRLQRRV